MELDITFKLVWVKVGNISGESSTETYSAAKTMMWENTMNTLDRDEKKSVVLLRAFSLQEILYTLCYPDYMPYKTLYKEDYILVQVKLDFCLSLELHFI